jgi:hypothetical protein
VAREPSPPSVYRGRNSDQPTEAEVQAKLAAARQRLHEIVVLQIKSWLPTATLNGLREAETWRRGEVRLHFQCWSAFPRCAASGASL